LAKQRFAIASEEVDGDSHSRELFNGQTFAQSNCISILANFQGETIKNSALQR